MVSPLLPKDYKLILQACHHDPFAVLGRHVDADQVIIRVFLPQAEQVYLVEPAVALERVPDTDLFIGLFPASMIPAQYQVRWVDSNSQEHIAYDPYCFPPLIGDLDLHLYGEGRHLHAYHMLGAHQSKAMGIVGIRFAVWAPSAIRVSVVGDFNAWDGRVHPMRVRGNSGIWELFIPELAPGTLYKYELRTKHDEILIKTDPYAHAYQVRPDTASIVTVNKAYNWQDTSWMQLRLGFDWQHKPISVYEVHLGSWRRDSAGNFLSYQNLARQLAAYANTIGFTHVELLPITEHPFDGSWGYQTTGYFAPTSRFGSPNDFREFIDILHQVGIGVILDWVPAHFPKDDFALARFDGTALYEHADPRQGEHRDWGTLIFNYGRNEVKNFLLASAIFWLAEYHIDALRVDAVASMLYRDYSKQPGDWVPNQFGGRENLEAIAFLQELNTIAHQRFPGSMIIAEESTAWPLVSRPTYVGGLGFSMKWNMGWMHDSLDYMSTDPIYRSHHHNQLTFGLLYAFSENFMLPLSHDEVVHGKKSLLDKMPGDSWQRFASLRLLYTWLYTYPGKKLLFMGNEFAQGLEWNYDTELDWSLLQHPEHQGIRSLVQDLNKLYGSTSALYDLEFEGDGFEWVSCNDSTQSVVVFLRRDRWHNTVIVVLNFTPVVHDEYRIGVPDPNCYRELFNSDISRYCGSNHTNDGHLYPDPVSWMGLSYSLKLKLPPLGGLVLALLNYDKD